MNGSIRVLSLAVVLLALATTAQAQSCAEYTKLPPPGHWAEWRVGADGFKVALLGQEVRQERTFVRMEMKINNKGRTVISQGLSTVDEPLVVDEMILKQGAQPAMKLPKELLSQFGSLARSNPSRVNCNADMTLVGQETVTVPAGTFTASRFKDGKIGDVWFSKDVPFGLVKAQSDKGEELLLVGYGADAKSEITETPVTPPRR